MKTISNLFFLSLLLQTSSAFAAPIWTGHAVCGSGDHTLDVTINGENTAGTFYAPNSDATRVLNGGGDYNQLDSSNGVQAYSPLYDQGGPLSRKIAVGVELNIDESGRLVRARIEHATGSSVAYEPCERK